MVNLGLTKVDDALAAKHPGLEQYAACQSRAFMLGSGSFVVAGTACFLFLQQTLPRALPFQWRLLASMVASTMCSFSVTFWESKKCTDLWLSLEKGGLPDSNSPKDEPPSRTTSADPKVTKYGDAME
ncbi:transmembrane protein 141 [Salminus brasiliensis]|uniref:transmembrane protein 141 n=1 Tax=Salminus brasiliensis TaxID=930266 RepID=UPI003B830C0B